MATIWKIFNRKLILLVVLVISGAVAFATLGDGKTKSNLSKNSLLSKKTPVKAGTFSLKSGYQFRGMEVINSNNEKKYINLNMDITVQKGNLTFIVPLKKKVFFDKVKIDIGNRQFQRN